MPGSVKNIQTSIEFWELYCDYIEYLKENPIIQQIANYGKITEIQHLRPQTLKGFINYTRSQGKSTLHYFSNYDNRYTEFVEVCQSVKLSIETSMLENALCGIIKESMTSKILGINEAVKIDVTGIKFDFDN